MADQPQTLNQIEAHARAIYDATDEDSAAHNAALDALSAAENAQAHLDHADRLLKEAEEDRERARQLASRAARRVADAVRLSGKAAA